MKKTIGIIGGMGPAATVDLFNLVVKNTDASSDQEHIHIIIDCNTNIPDRTDAIIHGAPSPIEELCNSARRLYRAGADFLIIPCNTSHYYINEIRSSVPIPIIDMIEETAAIIYGRGYNRSIILCTEGTRETSIYNQRLKKYEIETIYPDKVLQNEINRIIYDGVKSGREKLDVTKFNKLLHEMEYAYNAITVLGCTELPIAVDKYHLIGNFLNPTLILAKTAIERAGYHLKQTML